VLSFLADEDFNGAIVRELRRRLRLIDLERIQEIDRLGESDPVNLEYAAAAGRILLTHDKRLIAFAVQRIDTGKSMPGVFVVHQMAPMGRILDDIVNLTLYSLDGEWENQVLFIPLPA
jgi:hypothetical protein